MKSRRELLLPLTLLVLAACLWLILPPRARGQVGQDCSVCGGYFPVACGPTGSCDVSEPGWSCCGGLACIPTYSMGYVCSVPPPTETPTRVRRTQTPTATDTPVPPPPATATFTPTPTASPTPYRSVSSQAIIFPDTTLTGALQTVTGSTNVWQVENTYPAGADWHVTIAASDFTAGPYTIPVGYFEARLLDASIVTVSGSGPPGSTLTVFTPLSTAPQTLLSASGANGVGVYQLTPEFRLTVPPDTYTGAYMSVVTVTIIAGP